MDFYEQNIEINPSLCQEKKCPRYMKLNARKPKKKQKTYGLEALSPRIIVYTEREIKTFHFI